MGNILIECVWYKSKRDFNKFIKTIEEPNYTIVDYLIIKNKLIKADPYKQDPPDSVIGLNIINMIGTAFNKEKNPELKLIVYSFKNLTKETVINFRDLIESNTDEEYTLALNVLNMDKTPKREILNKFDCVKFIDND
jgi:hypothetical protein